MLSISVCIPCIEKHAKFLPTCLASISCQTHKPNEVVIVVSNITRMDETKQSIEGVIRQHQLNIIVEYTASPQFAGENRNRAIKIATGDIVSFIDADDMMRKDRLHKILSVFLVHKNCVGVLHYFQENEKPHGITCTCHDCSESFDLLAVEPYLFSHELHFGHGSFRRALFDKYQYTAKPRGQDVEFVHSILAEHIDNLYIYTRRLSFYISTNSSFYSI